jgi:cellulose biosynthesis protein BcsQ
LPAAFSHRKLDVTFNELKRSKHRLTRILDPLKNKYDLIILDCPVTISILAENIFNAVDYTLVPLIPTTLSVRTHRQLLSFCKKNKYDVSNIYSFFSMVDKRKKMHRELMATVLNEFNGILPKEWEFNVNRLPPSYQSQWLQNLIKTYGKTFEKPYFRRPPFEYVL